ncbi:hypothetical protein MTR67_052735 [Solanum verrucosum]|nr:hypothetical protein MTR67_001566 [Solanum verrucosum]WMV10779.1 hypothetical protein MTR67_004164 [Solanum verrucosum]WMV12453.1 hypothetical protein MTR67_005838 [Solanum verrucosum]WMV19482.1 hypothetical protein MTR67_012867 [Solanum verrucosum]WMV32535.1 hypothetical protein MTR67_025920 [Solanum verrucosum]
MSARMRVRLGTSNGS